MPALLILVPTTGLALSSLLVLLVVATHARNDVLDLLREPAILVLIALLVAALSRLLMATTS